MNGCVRHINTNEVDITHISDHPMPSSFLLDCFFSDFSAKSFLNFRRNYGLLVSTFGWSGDSFLADSHFE
jgi:hypothetical protein